MKKILLPLFYFITIQSKATTWNVNVDDFQFSPSALNVTVGDVIHWVWVGGTHTDTSVTIPAGAVSWNSPINSSQSSFDYTVTEAGTYSYQCNFHAAFGMVASFTASGVVPVTLSSFNITTKNKSPLLLWSTSLEINADHFSIRRSTDGSTFKEIGSIPASGNSSIEKNYSFTDSKIPADITYVYYALATIDKNGRTQLSPIKIYKNDFAIPKLIISISPNPVSQMGHLTLQYNAEKKSVMVAKLIDMQGKIILNTTLSSEPGVNNGHIHLMNIPKGIYIINFTLDGLSETYRLVKN